MERRHKNQVYLLVTIVYAILCMFVIGDDETTLGNRFLIVYLWIIIMLLTAMITEPQ